MFPKKYYLECGMQITQDENSSPWDIKFIGVLRFDGILRETAGTHVWNWTTLAYTVYQEIDAIPELLLEMKTS